MTSPVPKKPHSRLRRSPWFRRTKLFAKRLLGREPWLSPELRPPLRRFGDWALSIEGLAAGQIVYAFGVGTDLEFEVGLIREFGLIVHAFDPSPESMRWVARQLLPEALLFHPWAVAERDGQLKLHARQQQGDEAPVMYSAVGQDRTGPTVQVEALSCGSIVARLGHRALALVKMDIEGAEYGALRSMLAAGLRPAQLLVEFHHRFPSLGQQHTVQAVRSLSEAGYRIAYISDTGREFTFLRCA